MSILDKIAENVDYSQNIGKMLSLVKICKYFDFGQYCRTISILANIYEKSRLRTKIMKISILVKIVGKSWSWSTFSENLDFCQYLR